MNSAALIDFTVAPVEGTLPSMGVRPQLALSGTRCGRYTIEECLGIGSMGAVYRAIDPLLNREVALKSILRGIDELTVGLRFLREAEVLAKLEHPHVVRVLDAGVQNRTSFIVLEYLRGQPLRGLLDKRKRLSVAATLALLLPVVSAIDYAHTLGVLHLDLKPSNLFVTTDYLGRDRAMVLDFGVCQLTGVAAALDPTRDEHAGTPAYMAPEALHQEELTEAADQFALATLMYECLAGFSPFSRGSLRDMMMAKDAGACPNLTSLCSDATERLSEVLGRALSPKPADRYPTVGAFGAALLPVAPAEIAGKHAADFGRSSVRTA